MKDIYSLVLNFGSGSVSGAVIQITEKPGVEVLLYATEAISFQREISTERHLELAKTALSALLTKIQKKGIKVEKAFYIFASPWSASQTKTIRHKESKPFKLSEAYLKKIVDAETGMAEKKVIQIKANGYVLNEVNNKPVSESEISLFLTTVPENILKEINNIVDKFYIISHNYCHSLSLSIFSVIRDLFPHQDDFIYLDISEEMTDLAVIKGGIMTNAASLPFGRNQFVRIISEKLKVTEAVADSMIKMHTARQTDVLASVSANSVLDGISVLWYGQIAEAFNKFADRLYLPDKVFFVATSDITSLLSEKLKQNQFTVTPLESRKIHSPVKIDDTIFKIILTFLDKLYKI